MTYKEFYFWLDGFVTNRHWTQYRNEEITLILQKMKEVKDDASSLEDLKKRPDWLPIPVPVNPFSPNKDPLSPPWEITCETKTQLND
jgi:hypothetical protein